MDIWIVTKQGYVENVTTTAEKAKEYVINQIKDDFFYLVSDLTDEEIVLCMADFDYSITNWTLN